MAEPVRVRTLAPAGAIRPTGPLALGARAGDFVFVAGMRGIDPGTNALVPGDEARIRQAFRNMETIVQSEGATLRDAVRLVVYVTDMARHRPLVNKIQEELWGQVKAPLLRWHDTAEGLRDLIQRRSAGTPGLDRQIMEGYRVLRGHLAQIAAPREELIRHGLHRVLPHEHDPEAGHRGRCRGRHGDPSEGRGGRRRACEYH